jgi:hypothetical protein
MDKVPVFNWLLRASLETYSEYFGPTRYFDWLDEPAVNAKQGSSLAEACCDILQNACLRLVEECNVDKLHVATVTFYLPISSTQMVSYDSQMWDLCGLDSTPPELGLEKEKRSISLNYEIHRKPVPLPFHQFPSISAAYFAQREVDSFEDVEPLLIGLEIIFDFQTQIRMLQRTL